MTPSLAQKLVNKVKRADIKLIKEIIHGSRTDPFWPQAKYPYAIGTAKRFCTPSPQRTAIGTPLRPLAAALSPCPRTVVVAGHGGRIRFACRKSPPPKAFDDEGRRLWFQEESLHGPCVWTRHARPLQGSTDGPSCCTEIRLLCRTETSKKMCDALKSNDVVVLGFEPLPIRAPMPAW